MIIEKPSVKNDTITQLNLETKDPKPQHTVPSRRQAFFSTKCRGYNNNTLSNNAPDIESFLFGIGSTNLVHTLNLPKPDMNQLVWYLSSKIRKP